MPSAVYYSETNDNDSIESVASKLVTLIRKSDVLSCIKTDDFTALKLHFGEEGNKGHIRPEWVREAVKLVSEKTKNAFLTDSNVLYKESQRADSVHHLALASRHGFSLEKMGVPVLIADGIFGRNFTEIPIHKKRFTNVKIASDIAQCDSLVALTHVTGHMLSGFGGAIKNLGMGCASRRGKYEQHSGVVPSVDQKSCIGCELCQKHCPSSSIIMESGKAKIMKDSCIGCGECVIVCKTKAIDTQWSETLENFQEKMVEYAYGADKAVLGKVAYISFVINVTRDCDCLAKDEPKILSDIGILASDDPVSIDKASADLLNERRGRDIFREQYAHIDWTVQLNYAEKIGLGSQHYIIKKV